jgi:hypothetical protein
MIYAALMLCKEHISSFWSKQNRFKNIALKFELFLKNGLIMGAKSAMLVVGFKIKVAKTRLFSPSRVGRDGIEPPTQGFSVLCSTD